MLHLRLEWDDFRVASHEKCQVDVFSTLIQQSIVFLKSYGILLGPILLHRWGSVHDYLLVGDDLYRAGCGSVDLRCYCH